MPKTGNRVGETNNMRTIFTALTVLIGYIISPSNSYSQEIKVDNANDATCYVDEDATVDIAFHIESPKFDQPYSISVSSVILGPKTVENDILIKIPNKQITTENKFRGIATVTVKKAMLDTMPKGCWLSLIITAHPQTGKNIRVQTPVYTFLPALKDDQRQNLPQDKADCCSGDFGYDLLSKSIITNLPCADVLNNSPSGGIRAYSVYQPNYIVTPCTFNKFVAQKVAYYLAGTNDLSLYENFAIADAADGRLTVGHNWTYKRAEERVKWVATAGVQTNVANDFATIFGRKKFSNETGVLLKYTYLLSRKTYIGSNPSQRQSFNTKRDRYFCNLRAQIAQEREFCCSMNCCDDSAREEYRTDAFENHVSNFYDFELEELNSRRPAHGYQSFFTHWFSIQAYIPFTRQLYSIAPDTAYKFVDQQFYNWSAAINYAGVWEKRWGTFFYNASVRVFQNNSINAKDSNVTSFNKATYTPTTTSGTTLLSGESETVYVGNYKTYLTPVLEGQAVYLGA